MKTKRYLITSAVSVILLISACSPEEDSESMLNPDGVVENYVSAWEERNGEGMAELFSESSLEEVDAEQINRAFSEIGETIEVSSIQVNYESQNHLFEEDEEAEESTAEQENITSLTYPVTVEMETGIGEREYITDVFLTLDENSEWRVEWQADHIFSGMQEVTDRLQLETTGKDSLTRGEIFDRNGDGLAVNGEYHNAGFVYMNVEDAEKEAETFAEILGIESSDVLAEIKRHEDNPDWHAPVMSMPLEDERVEELRQADIPGLSISTYSGRVYPQSYATAQLVGFLQDMQADDLEEADWIGYEMGSQWARFGLEREFEEQLRGTLGEDLQVVDQDGNYRERLSSEEPEDGEEIHTTIDSKLQWTLMDILGDDAGAAVVMDPSSGEMLAMVSTPTFEPNQTYLGTASPEREEWRADDRGVTDRRFNQPIVPGSVFKPFTAAIGMEEGTLDPEEILHIEGEQWQPEDGGWGDREITRVEENTDEVDLTAGMKYSDNIYFARQALEFGGEVMEEWAEKFGFGTSMNLEYPFWPSQLSNDGLSSETLLADTAYGQGEVLMSPVHLTVLYSMFVNAGDVVQPTLLIDEAGGTWEEGVISEETASTVLDTLYAVTEDPNGTAYRSSPGHSFRLASKTGTAELDAPEQSEDIEEEVDGDRIGWYVSTDAENYIVTMMIEGEPSSTVVDRANEFWAEME
ncbi:penicillin-binding transpeptidase domain-containing protein [Alteribacter natronophilus]|uniref:penicillin-binding transpeptidase domain-containing protein n=1 Tax=Alteribacter natronophilus TaxID=2583810 RepID=UPI00110EA147|nr:penicillin-binding transpeptidase domain-containing protein [Alteribacter natronophilus]TMW72363.1 hypothetical protein FGB90_09160 [Alteribacter natronophilus]